MIEATFSEEDPGHPPLSEMYDLFRKKVHIMQNSLAVMQGFMSLMSMDHQSDNAEECRKHHAQASSLVINELEFLLSFFGFLAARFGMPWRGGRLYRISALNVLLQGADSVQDFAKRYERVKISIPQKLRDSLAELCVYANSLLYKYAVNCVLDNACKYSSKESIIRVSWSLIKDSLVMNVASQGLAVQKNDIPLMVKRGWRGKEAKAVNPAGTGFGLWIAREIMIWCKNEMQIKTHKSGTLSVCLKLNVFKKSEP